MGQYCVGSVTIYAIEKQYSCMGIFFFDYMYLFNFQGYKFSVIVSTADNGALSILLPVCQPLHCTFRLCWCYGVCTHHCHAFAHYQWFQGSSQEGRLDSQVMRYNSLDLGFQG